MTMGNTRAKVNNSAHGLDLDFVRAAANVGVIIDRLQTDGKLRRCQTKGHPEEKNGAYWFNPGSRCGWFQNWEDGEDGQLWFSSEPDDRTEGEKHEAHLRDARKKEADAKKLKALNEATARAEEKRFLAASPAIDHRYLENKGVAAHGARIDADGKTLLVPVQDGAGRIMCLQRIAPDGKKLFPYGGRMLGGMFPIGEVDPEGVILIGEGFATMAILYEGTGHPAICAFTASNLPTVARAIREKYPNARICVCADDDHVKEALGRGNAGIKKSREAAAAIGGALAIPRVRGGTGSDFNDMAWDANEGIDAVAEVINGALGAVNGKAHKVAAKANPAPMKREMVAMFRPMQEVGDDTNQHRDIFAPVGIARFPSTGRDGPSKTSIPNVREVLNVAGITPRWDMFSQRVSLLVDGSVIPMDEGVLKDLLGLMHDSGLETSLSFTNTAIEVISQKNKYDSAIDFFNSLPKWDGTTRAETLLIDELGADDTPYTRGATRFLFSSLVRRGMGIESKCDEMVILRGEQGIGKSTAFKFLIGEDFFQENLKMSHSTREVLELTLGKLLVEMGELSGMKKADRDDVKRFFSTTSDEFSMKFEKHATKRQRRFAFIGTANPEGKIANMLEEDRRFIIVPVTKAADLDRIKRDRLQILAEAMEIERSYGPRLELKPELRPDARKARAGAVARPEYESAIEEAFKGIVSAKIAASDVYAFLGLRDRTAIGKFTKTSGGGINPIMERLGWRYSQIRKHSHASQKGNRVWAFVKGDENGWLRAIWPHGPQAPAEIDTDEDASPNWVPKYADELPA